MAVIEGLGDRLREARAHAGVRQRRNVSQALMAKLVTEELSRMGTEMTVSQAAWSDYERDATPPSLAVIRAASRVSGVSEIYITYGVVQAQPMRVAEPIPPTQPNEAISSKPAAAKKRRGRAG